MAGNIQTTRKERFKKDKYILGLQTESWFIKKNTDKTDFADNHRQNRRKSVESELSAFYWF